MNIELVGFVTIAAGVLSVLLGYRAAFQIFVCATLLGSAAALLIGPENIQPAHLLLAFVTATVFTRHDEAAAAVRAIQAPKSGFWLLCLVLYAVISAFVMPRLLAGTTQIVPLGTSEYASNGSTVPLGPVSGNFTQAVYLVADLICFVMTAAIVSTRQGFVAVAASLTAYAVGNTLFAVVDLGTYATNTQWVLDFVRNAHYTLHSEAELSGLKRIVGSFTEASTFARSTLGVLGFTGTMWLCGRQPVLNGFLALSSVVFLVISTSSTGLVGAPIVLLILYVTALMRHGVNPETSHTSAVLLCAPVVVGAVSVAIMLDSHMSTVVRDYADLLVFNKPESNSGIERDIWNTDAFQNCLDSYGLGVGLGTVRTSSLLLALLSNVGLAGSMFYALFVVTALWRPHGPAGSFTVDVRLAAANACLGLIIADCFVSPVVEQGLLFYVLAGTACAQPEQYAAYSPIRSGWRPAVR